MDILSSNYGIGSDYKLEEEARQAYAPCCVVEGCENPGRTTVCAGSTLLLCDEHSLVVRLLKPLVTRLEADIQALYAKLDMLVHQHRSLADDVRTIEYTMYEETEETV